MINFLYALLKMAENEELDKILIKAEYYHYNLQTYILQMRTLKSITFEYTDDILFKIQDIDAKIRILKHYLIDLNNKMLDIKYNGEPLSKKQNEQINAFLFKCCSN